MNKKTAFEIARGLNTQTRLTPGEEGIRAARAEAADRDDYIAGMALQSLRIFFQSGRNKHGGMMSINEHVVNACERNLSLYTDAELREMIHGADAFRRLAENEMRDR